jgi:N-acetylmuramic acid 6-phosphate (MurNAc-6-P) etherase
VLWPGSDKSTVISWSTFAQRNKKLIERGVSIVERIAQVDREVALQTLKSAGMSVTHALVMLKANVDKREASRRLREKNGIVRHALKGQARGKLLPRN